MATKTKTKKQLKLPSKPSALIRVALKDLDRVERNKKYRVDMNVWHEPNGQCAVCFAGAVMTRAIPPTENYLFSKFPRDMEAKFDALDSLRGGLIDFALDSMNMPKPPKLPKYVIITPYSVSAKGFKKDMCSLACLLEKHGL